MTVPNSWLTMRINNGKVVVVVVVAIVVVAVSKRWLVLVLHVKLPVLDKSSVSDIRHVFVSRGSRDSLQLTVNPHNFPPGLVGE
jgi:hypothetical protein